MKGFWEAIPFEQRREIDGLPVAGRAGAPLHHSDIHYPDVDVRNK